MVAVEVVRRVLAVAGGVGTRALGETAQQRRHRRRDTAEAFGDERDDGVLLVLDRVGVVLARLRRHPTEAGRVVERAVCRRAPRPRAVDVAEQLLAPRHPNATRLPAAVDGVEPPPHAVPLPRLSLVLSGV